MRQISEKIYSVPAVGLIHLTAAAFLDGVGHLVGSGGGGVVAGVARIHNIGIVLA